MKLYIWNEPYRVSYGSSFLFVVARDEKTARKLAAKAQINQFGLGPRRDGNPLGEMELGAPRVEELPFAECYEWSE